MPRWDTATGHAEGSFDEELPRGQSEGHDRVAGSAQQFSISAIRLPRRASAPAGARVYAEKCTRG